MKFLALGAFLRALYENYPAQTLFGAIILGFLYYYYDKSKSISNKAHTNNNADRGSDNKYIIGKIVTGKELRIGMIVKMKGDYWAEVIGLSKTNVIVDDDGRRISIPLRLEQKYLVN